MLTGYSTAHFEKMGYEFTLTMFPVIIPQTKQAISLAQAAFARLELFPSCTIFLYL